MATIQKELILEVDASSVWDALRDFHAVDKRVAPGFVTRSEKDGDTRIITFSNGSVAREMLVSSNDATRRLVYAISNERLKHYNASVQVVPEREGSRFIWTVDFLPSELAGYIDGQMELALKVIKPTLDNAVPVRKQKEIQTG